MFGSPGRIFHHVIRILVSESSFFIVRYSTVVSSNFFNSNAVIFECFEIFKFVWIQLLVADAIKMATKRKHHEVTLKVKYETLKNLKRVGLIKVLQTNSVFLVVLLLLERITKEKSLKLFKIHYWNDKEWKLEYTKS